MLTRLQVNGFKNLVGVDVRFGPFTCIAGGNGVGKSNLFDAIRFLGALADLPINEAAGLIRDESGRGDLKSLFTALAGENFRSMSFAAEVIIPPSATDELRREAKASATYLRYEVRLGLREPSATLPERIVVEEEHLVPLLVGDIDEELVFDSSPEWRKGVVHGKRGKIRPLITTENQGGDRVIVKRSQEVRGGRPREFLAEDLPRTVLSDTSAVEGPTALIVREELKSWRLLQLEPSALRKASAYRDLPTMTSEGARLPATLRRLMASESVAEAAEPGVILQAITNRLAELLSSVADIRLVDDPTRSTYAIALTDRSGVTHPATSLSDGTLRFLALAVLELDPEAVGVICMEEPENGIHPERIPAMLELLRAIAVDPSLPPGEDNPLRQVIVNTHAPAVVQQAPFESLLFAQHRAVVTERHGSVRAVGYLPPPQSVRAVHARSTTPPATLMPYLVPVDDEEASGAGDKLGDQPWVQQLLLPINAEPA